MWTGLIHLIESLRRIKRLTQHGLVPSYCGAWGLLGSSSLPNRVRVLCLCLKVWTKMETYIIASLILTFQQQTLEFLSIYNHMY